MISVARDSTRYDPLNLAEEFKQDGIHVRFRAHKRDVMTTRMWGTPVHIEDMLRVEVLD